MPDRKKRRPEKRNAEPSPYVPGGRNPCSECGSSGRIKKTELVLNSRLRHMLCGICGHRWTLAERRPQEELDAEYAAARLEASYGGRLGHLVEPTIEPLGFDWKMGIGLIGAFAAREVFVSTMGVVYGLGDAQDEESPMLRDKLRSERRPDGSKAFTPLVCFSLLVFFALACQCSSTLAMVYRETKTWRWPVFLFTYTLVLAWMASLIVFQGGSLLGYA